MRYMSYMETKFIFSHDSTLTVSPISG